MSLSSRRCLRSALVAAALAFSTTSAFAEGEAAPPPKTLFGDVGQFALSLNHTFAVTTDDVFAGGTELQAAYFIAPSLSLGVGIGAEWVSSPSILGSSPTNLFIFRVGPRLGYDLHFSDFVSVWPQVGVDYRRTDSSPHTSGSVPLPTTTMNSAAFVALAPILIHPTKGFFLGAGPALYVEVANSTSTGGSSTDNGKTTSFGLMATIGGAI